MASSDGNNFNYNFNYNLYATLNKYKIKFHEIDNVTINDECTICFENKCNMKTACNHSFCIDCYIKVYYIVGVNKKCIFCRQPLPDSIQIFSVALYIKPIYIKPIYIEPQSINCCNCFRIPHIKTACGHIFCIDCFISFKKTYICKCSKLLSVPKCLKINDDDDMLCYICYVNDCEIKSSCGHYYCADCFSEVYIHKNSCSFCRQNLDLPKITSI